MRVCCKFAPTLVMLSAVALLFFGVPMYFSATMPLYRDSLGSVNHTEKITGRYLLAQSAARDDNLIIYGSSELATLDIPTHPSNFFAGKRCGFQVNIVGRGSCQSLIHAISIAASGDALTGKKVVLITSPQSYVEQGIAPDLFMANFSPQQFLELLSADDLTKEVRQAISARIFTLFDRYEATAASAVSDPSIRWLAEHNTRPNPVSFTRNAVLSPYYIFCRYLFDLKDKALSRALLESAGEAPLPAAQDIDWAEEERAAVLEAARMTANNEFGMLDDYYTTNIGTRLARFKDRDLSLDYSASEEYGDLRLLFEVCRQKGITPLFIHVPLHGAWSDYTGFSAERRQKYYENVRAVAEEYRVKTLDLTGYEYEEYFLCDVMHLGWKGWIAVDRALIDYYYDR